MLSSHHRTKQYQKDLIKILASSTNRKEHNQGNQDKRRTEQEDKEPNKKDKTQNFKSIIFRGQSGLCFIAILVAQKEAQIFEDTMGSSSSYY
jgi:hypothetical protein